MNCMNKEPIATNLSVSEGVSSQASADMMASAPAGSDMISNKAGHVPRFRLAPVLLGIPVNPSIMPATVIRAAEVIIIPDINSTGYFIVASSKSNGKWILAQLKFK